MTSALGAISLILPAFLSGTFCTHMTERPNPSIPTAAREHVGEGEVIAAVRRLEPAAVFPVTDHPALSRPGANEKVGRVREWGVGGRFGCHAKSFLWLRKVIILFCTKIIAMPLPVIRIVLP